MATRAALHKPGSGRSDGWPRDDFSQADCHDDKPTLNSNRTEKSIRWSDARRARKPQVQFRRGTKVARRLWQKRGVSNPAVD